MIFYENDEPKAAAVDKSSRPIVIEIEPLTYFRQAEGYYQDHYRNHRNAPYCQMVIRPKLEKLDQKH